MMYLTITRLDCIVASSPDADFTSLAAAPPERFERFLPSREQADEGCCRRYSQHMSVQQCGKRTADNADYGLIPLDVPGELV